MNARITNAERRRVAEWITDAQQLLAGVEVIERQIATTLGVTTLDDRDVITEAISLPLTVDELLLRLQIGVVTDRV
jgi:hypothetical protein